MFTGKVISFGAAIAFLFLVLSVDTMAQVSATGHITAEVIDAITAGESNPMSFGRFTAGDQRGSIVISPASGNSMTTSSVLPSGSEINPATFSISGADGAAFSVVLPQIPTTLTSLSGTGTLTVTDWAACSGRGSDSCQFAGGTQTVRVGATLKVGAADETPGGCYTGSYQVTFSYN